jgi:hypothetical protein
MAEPEYRELDLGYVGEGGAVNEIVSQMEEVQAPLYASTDGFFVAARGGTLIELNVTEQST